MLGGTAGPAGPGRSPRCPLHPQCPVLSLPDVVKGLFVCCLFLDYVSLSQRFIPELLNFLLGILYIAAPGRPGQGEFIRGRFPVGCALQRDEASSQKACRVGGGKKTTHLKSDPGVAPFRLCAEGQRRRGCFLRVRSALRKCQP